MRRIFLLFLPKYILVLFLSVTIQELHLYLLKVHTYSTENYS
jgi:hypothetical protein